MKTEPVSWFRRAFLRHGPRRYATMQPESADRKYNDYPGELTDTQIRDHLDGRAAYAVPTAENGLAHLLPFDIDAGGEDAARALLDAARERGLWAFAQVDTARGRGYVFIPFDELASAERIRLLGEDILKTVQHDDQAHAWRIENRATNEDTRLPFARHRWTQRRGQLITQDGSAADLDGDDYPAALDAFAQGYHENPTDQLPPPPETRQEARSGAPSGPGVTIASYNAATDLVTLLESHGARRAKGQGARLYFCPFHADDHASLLITRDGERCKCLSQGSDCPLSGHLYDAFNVFCIGEGLTTAQALRRLNGHPDDPKPQSNPPSTPRKGGPAAPPTPSQEGHREANRASSGHRSTQKSASAALRPSQAVLDLPAKPTEARTTASDGRRLPKTCRRLLDIIAEHPGGYIRGKYTLARLLDCDPRTVQRSLRRLEAEGLIERQERGRDGQTDIYRTTSERPATGDSQAYRLALPEEEGGRHLPPTLELDIYTNPETLEAERGGQPDDPAPEPGSGQAYRLALPEPDQDGATHGPGGAVSYPQGAAYVPPEAIGWYAAQQAATPRATVAEQRDATPQATEPEQAELPTAPPPATRKRRRSRTRYVDPGHLYGRIIAAEKKAAKLEATGRDADRRQARAIRRQAETLKRQLEALREAPPQATDQDEEAAQDWTPAPTLPTAPPVSSLPGVDWLYLERLARAGEQRGIETHCRLCRVDVREVCAELAQRVPLPD